MTSSTGGGVEGAGGVAGEAGSQLVELPKAGHFANMEEPTAFNRVLKEFLYSLTGSGQQGR